MRAFLIRGAAAWNDFIAIAPDGPRVVKAKSVSTGQRKALSYECRIGQRMRNECHFWHPFIPVEIALHALFMRVIILLFQRYVISFSCVKRYSFLMS